VLEVLPLALESVQASFSTAMDCFWPLSPKGQIWGAFFEIWIECVTQTNNGISKIKQYHLEDVLEHILTSLRHVNLVKNEQQKGN
jgi:hypothetical protein